MLRLHVRQHPDQFIKLSSSISLGSNKNNDLVLRSPSVSDFHAEILVDGETLAIVDLLSAGGTFINSHPIAQKASIKPWDIIQLGDVELELVDPNSCRPGDWGLRSKSNSLAAKVYPLLNEVVLGRDATCDLRIESNLLSRQHARITVTPDRLLVCDLNSTNGSYLNGERIEQADVFPGDELRFDKLIFEVIGPVSTPDSTISDETVVRNPTDDDATEYAQHDEPDEEATRFIPSPMPVAFIKAPPGLMQPQLLQLIKTQYSVGRHPDCDICIGDNSLSKQHAHLLVADGHWWLQDQDSSNGSWINNERTSKAQLHNGDSIRLGRVELMFTLDTPASHTPASQSTTDETKVCPPEKTKNQPAKAETSRTSVWKLALWSGLITLAIGAAGYGAYLYYLQHHFNQ